MHLLYVDESGSIENPNDRFFILAGVAVFERHTHWIEKDLNAIAEQFDKEEPHRVELHGSPMRSGKGVWRQQPQAVREQAIIDAWRLGSVTGYIVRVCSRLFSKRQTTRGRSFPKSRLSS